MTVDQCLICKHNKILKYSWNGEIGETTVTLCCIKNKMTDTAVLGCQFYDDALRWREVELQVG